MLIEDLPKDALILILDADSISYSIVHQLKTNEFKEVADLLIDDYVNQLYGQVGASHIAGYLGGLGNFRFEVAKTKGYKANRPEMPEEDRVLKQYITEYLVTHYNFERVNGMEADDAVSMAAVQLKQAGINYLICSNDKDVDQVPGNHYSMNKRVFYHVTEDEAALKLWTQMITGDSTDNIPGLPRKGKAYAEKLLGDKKTQIEMEYAVRWSYDNYVPNPAGGAVNFAAKTYFEEQKALLTLLTSHSSFIPEVHLIDKSKINESSLSGL